MRVHILQHVAFEGLGSIAPWLAARNATVSWTRFFEDPALPQVEDVDWLIALGGPMSVNDEPDLPWLVDEKAFVRQTIAAGKPVLGICLGAQLIASALGSLVHPGREKEIGWFDIESTPVPPDASSTCSGTFAFPPKAKVFHWHGETFDLPPGAVRLARSIGCENQAFQIARHVIGLQFHLETTPESADQLVSHCRHELTGGAFIQSEAELRAAPLAAYAGINALMSEVLDYLAPAS